MKANELRIGNWVNNNEDYQITSATILQLERNDSTAKPIPITEEWLLKFFGKKVAEEWFLHEFNFPLYLSKTGLVIRGLSVSYLNVSDLKIQYVHQLQNLYFALTNTELEIL